MAHTVGKELNLASMYFDIWFILAYDKHACSLLALSVCLCVCSVCLLRMFIVNYCVYIHVHAVYIHVRYTSIMVLVIIY